MLRVVFLLLFIGFSFLGISQSYTIEGFITEKGTLSPVVGGSVFIPNTSYGSRTNGKGYYKITGIPKGSYDLTTLIPGFVTFSKHIDLSQHLTIDVALEEKIMDLPQLVIESQSLSLGKQGMEEIPGSVHYISAADLKNYNYTNVNNVMKMVPGVNIQEEEGFGLRPNIGLRGSGLERSARITLMEDGILSAPAPYASPSAYYFPTMGRMNGVEVLKGASQIRFGPFTTGGAINFISTPIPNQFATKFQLTGGSYGYRNLHAYVGNSYDQVGFLVEAFQYGADGFKQLPNDGDTGFDKKDYQLKLQLNTSPDKTVYQSLNLTAGQTIEQSNETYLGLSSEDFAKDPYQRYAASQVDNMDAEQTRFSAQHYLEIPGWFNVVTTVYRNDFKRNWYKLQSIENSVGINRVLDNPQQYQRAYSLLQGNSDSDSVSLNVRANNREYYAQGIQSVIDIEFETGSIAHDIHISGRLHEDQEDRYQWEDGYAINEGIMKLVAPGTPGTQANRIETANAFAGYIFYKLSVDRFTFTPGVRHESVTISRTDYGKNDVDRLGTNLSERENRVNAWLPGVGINYTLNDKLNVFGGIHRGFAPPGSAPETTPEVSNNIDVGIRRTKSRVEGSLILFYNDYQNLLGRDIAAAGGVGSGDVFNAGTAVTQGVEFQVGFNALDHLKSVFALPITFSYTYTDSYFTKSFESDFGEWDNVQRGDELPYVAKNQFYSSIGLQNNHGSLFINGKYQSDLRTIPGSGSIPGNEIIPSFWLMDVSANIFINKYASINISINNVLNNKYAVASRPTGLRPGMPRTINAGVKVNL